MMTSAQALEIYRAGPETVVRVLLEMDARIDALTENFEKRIGASGRPTGQELA